MEFSIRHAFILTEYNKVLTDCGDKHDDKATEHGDAVTNTEIEKVDEIMKIMRVSSGRKS